MDGERVAKTLASMQSFADALRKRAEELGYTNAEVARRAGLTERRYGNYVAGVREPDLETLARIAKVLSTTPNALLGFGESGAAAAGDKLLEKLAAHAAALPKADLEAVTVQVEALAAYRRKPAHKPRGTRQR